MRKKSYPKLSNFEKNHLMKKYLLSLLFVTASSINIFSQTQNTALYDPFNARLRPKYNDSLPEFVKLTLKPNANMFEVARAFEVFEKAQKAKGENEIENPFDVYYHRWRRAYAPFVQEDGTIKLPSYTAFQEKLKAENTAYNAETRNKATKQEKLTSNWTNIGPKETFWLKDDYAAQTACPWQANIYAFDVSKSNNNVLYAATETGAVFKTTDKGLNWTVCANGFNFGGSAEAVAIHPTNPNIVFLGVGSNIYKSIDGGNTWTSVYSGIWLYPNAIAISPTDPNLVLVSAYAGLFRSTDAGATWTQVYSESCDDVQINPLSTTHVFVLKYNGTNIEFLKSTDSGENFTTYSMGGLTDASSGRLAVTGADVNRIYALLTTDSGSKLIKSSDEGATWTNTSVTFCTGGISDATGGQGYYDLALAVSPTDANKIIFGLCSTHKSTDGGATSNFLGGYCGSVAVHPDLQEVKCVGNDVWVATDGGLTLSTDFFASDYEARNNGIFATDFWGFGQGWNEDIMVGGRYHNGNTAMADFYPAGKALRMGGAEAGTGYVLPGQTRAAVFSDLGNGWTLPETFNSYSGARFAFTKYPNEDYYGYNSSPLTTDPRYAKHIYLGEGTTFWKTTDGGATFNVLHDFGSQVRRYEISRSNPNVLYLTTDDDFYKSTDGGVNWVSRNIPLGHTTTNMRFSLSATDENLLWAVFENFGSTLLGKVYKSTNGGSTWTDMTTNTLNGYNIKWIQLANNTEGGVYIAAVNSKGFVFYTDNSKSDWEDFSTNLPASMDIIRLLPFYRDAKLRVAGNRGVWETPLYNENFAPIAQPITDKKTSRCVRDTFYFDDYSIVKHAGTTWAWSFSPTPQYISNTNSRNPKVVFGNIGDYNVTLTVTNSNGTSTKTEANMVSILTDECSPETVAGKAMNSTTTSDYFLTPSVNLGTTNTVTLMAWIKPNGQQADFTGIITSSNPSVGINLTSNHELRLNWNESEWWWASGLTVPTDKWSHIALVMTGTEMIFYLNGKAATNAIPPVLLDLSHINWYIGCDRGRSDRVFKGMIDEVALYSRALTQTEIREQMHLTKLSSDAALMAYFQFNETSGDVYNRISAGSAALLGSATRTTSTAPVASGTSETQTVTSSGVKTFSAAGVTLTFPNSGTLPNGDLCITRLNSAPDQLPNNYPSAAKNWIINNYGTNATFAALTNMTLTGYGAISQNEASNPSNFKLYKREMGETGNNWGSSVGSGTTASAGTDGIIAFGTPSITSFSQFTIMQEATVLPLVLNDFTAQKVEKKYAQLNWTTQQEKNLAHFDIERSYNGSHFENVGTIKAIGQSTDKQAYSFLDNASLSGLIYYRLRMVDADRHVEFSKVQALDFDKSVDVLIYPNPIGKGKTLVIKTNLDEPYDFKITNISGKTVLTKTFTTPEVQLDTEGLGKGLYLFELKSKTHWRFGKIVVE
jgi:photosystem II stability/assembly factor-like uncharacterized protein